MRSRLVLTFLVSVALISAYVVSQTTAHTNGTGIGGTSTSGCGPSDCHGISASTTTTVHIWTDSTSFSIGTTYLFHVSVSSSRTTQKAAGCAISTDNSAALSVPTSETDLQKIGSQLTHRSPRSFNGTDSTSWTFNFKPTKSGATHIYAAGNAVIVDNNSNDDLWNKTSFTLTVESSGVNQEPSANPNIEIYPNPTSGPLVIASIDATDATVQISDESGRVQVTQHLSLSEHSTIDLSSLANGAYFVRVVPKDGMPTVKRISIQK